MKNKETCKFYNEEKDVCTALNDLYCEKDIKPCSFHKPKKTVKPKESK